MAGSADIFQTVRNAVDIVDVVAEYVALKRAGKEFKGLCPFHDDHRPSMAVVPQKQIFHCFVCGTGGDVFKFVQGYHKMTPGEALRFLAQRAGIKLPELPRRDGRPAGEGPSLREQITATNEKTTAYFEKLLRSDAGQPGLDYFRSRGLTDETLARFRLGMSPDGWTGLVTAAPRLALSGDQLVTAGLAKKRSDGSPFDVFRGRVIFPIFDTTGRIIAFGGRVLVEKRDESGAIVEPKYLNSPETAVFVKSEALYGLHLAKPQIIKTQTVVVVEGYMDVIACHQAGVTNVVATLGTALTPEHARLLRRFCNTVVLVFDSDDAGHRAADRALETFVREPLDVKIAAVTDGKDPCDFCMAHGGPAFEKIVAGATDALAYQWARLQKQFHGSDSLSARQTATRQFMEFVAKAFQAAGSNMDPIRRGLLLSKLSDLVGLPTNEISTMLAHLGRLSVNVNTNSSSNSPAPGASLPSPPTGAEGVIRGAGAGADGGAGAVRAEGWVLGALLSDPKLYEKIRADFSLDYFPTCAPLASRVLEYLESASDLTTCSLADFCSAITENDLITQAIRLQSDAEVAGKVEEILISSWKFLQDKALDKEPASPQDPQSGLRDALARARQQREKGAVRRTFGPRRQ